MKNTLRLGNVENRKNGFRKHRKTSNNTKFTTFFLNAGVAEPGKCARFRASSLRGTRVQISSPAFATFFLKKEKASTEKEKKIEISHSQK